MLLARFINWLATIFSNVFDNCGKFITVFFQMFEKYNEFRFFDVKVKYIRIYHVVIFLYFYINIIFNIYVYGRLIFFKCSYECGAVGIYDRKETLRTSTMS